MLGVSHGAVLYRAEAVVQIQGGLGPQDSDIKADGVPVDAQASAVLPPVFGGAAQAQAGAATIGGSVDVSKGTGASGNTFGSSFSEIEISDLIVSKLPGFEGLPNTVDVTVSATVNYTQTTVSSTSDDLRIRLGFGVTTIADFTAPATGAVVSHNVSLPVGSPFTLTFNGFLDGNANGGNDTGESVNHQFFAALNPVQLLDLPAGYTANAVGIVQDNQIIPEPSSATLLVLGGLALIKRRVRRARTHG